MFRTRSLFALLTTAYVLITTPSLADGWERWRAHNAQSTATIDHTAWQSWLQTYVTTDERGLNRVDYAGVSDADRQKLKNYLETLQAVDIDAYNRDEQMAFWINLYNAKTVDLVIDALPVTSIRAIRPNFFDPRPGPWRAKVLMLNGEELSLDDIEHRILRPLWGDPRVHYGVNCASVGCPNLAADAYTGAELDAMLTAGARAYVNSDRGVRALSGNGVDVSSIYSWFKKDFGDNDAGVIAHLKKYADQDLAAELEGVTRISDHGYDWDLNATTNTAS